MELYYPIANFSGEFSAKGSKFIALGFTVEKEEEVKIILKELRANPNYKNARHFCYAYRLGCPVNEFRANDDGEPSGTAGKPILSQLESRGLTNILVVVIRFFGGILLGTGGLIQAYKESTKNSLEHIKLSPIEPMSYFEVSGEYSWQMMVENRCIKAGAEIIKKEFADGFKFEVKISQKLADEWAIFLAESSQQSVHIKLLKNC